MLAENIQRNSLTPYEQAQGSNVLDLGADIPEIMEKTGFSESTVRHRLKLAELDQDLFKGKVRRADNNEGSYKTRTNKDPDRKNGALKEIGTNNFDWAVRNAIGVEENEEKIAKIEDWLIPFAEKSKKRCRKARESSKPSTCTMKIWKRPKTRPKDRISIK